MRRIDPALGLAGKLLFDEHTNAALVNARCGATWGEMAPPDDRPGVLHWCMRPMVTVPDLDNPEDGPPAVSHPGQHRCTCGEYHTFDPAPQVICRFPKAGLDGEECGAVLLGMRREVHQVPGSVMAGRSAVTFAIVRSNPCNHVVRRGF